MADDPGPDPRQSPSVYACHGARWSDLPDPRGLDRAPHRPQRPAAVRQHIEDGYAEMLAGGLAAGTVRKVHALVSSAYEIEVKRGNVARNPCRLVEAPRLEQADKASLSAVQARAVLAAVAKRRNATRWSVGLACGLRQGEALGLRWEYLDLESGEMQIWHQLQRLPWRHGCADVAKCTEGRHRRPCPRSCPKAARKSGRRHVCIAGDAPRLCKGDARVTRACARSGAAEGWCSGRSRSGAAKPLRSRPSWSP